MQIAAANPVVEPIEFPYEPPSWIPEYRDALLQQPFVIDKEGYVEVPDKPGLGFEIDEQVLNRHGRKFFEMTPGKMAWKSIRQRGLINTLKIARAKKRG